MGIWGLTSYISNSSILKPYQLCDSQLVVDGNCVIGRLYHSMVIADSVFGGDYDEMYKLTSDFFKMLLRCNIQCIVLMDGGRETKKIKTSLQRVETTLPILRKFFCEFSTAKFFPLLAKSAYMDALRDLNVSVFQCELEADRVIAAIARCLNCPVLSYDSDFYVYDVLYIPFDTVQMNAVQRENSSKYYVSCSVYDVQNFVNHYPGLDKSVLPILAVLLGNDYTHSSVFSEFYQHLSVRPKKNYPYLHSRIHSVLHWLKNEDLNSAMRGIMFHVSKKNEKKVLTAIKSSISNYTSCTMSEYMADELPFKLENVTIKNERIVDKLPSEIVKSLVAGKIHKFIIDIINLGIYVTLLQVENVFKESSHFASMDIIKDIYTLLTPYIIKGKAKERLKIYLADKNRYTFVIVERDPENFLNNILLSDLLKESKEERLKWFCSILGIDDDILNIVQTNNWSVFLVSLVYWTKKLKGSITREHVHALLLMAIANEVVQKELGYFRFYCKKKKPKKTNEPATPGVVELKKTMDFDEMLKNVTRDEKLSVQDILIPYRQTTALATTKGYSISTLHLFACFQSILFHVKELNALLDFPLPDLRSGDFYSGTLLFNLYLNIKNKPQVESFALKLFDKAPNLKQVYDYLSESCSQFTPSVSTKSERKKNQNRIRLVESNERFALVGGEFAD